MYAATKTAPNGKLRLLYECNPLSFIMEQAGGRSTNGQQRILELELTDLHQRTPIFMGSPEMVYRVEELILQNSILLKQQPAPQVQHK